MPPENIDDLFREKLDGHATPPGDALWARLQASTPPDVQNGSNSEERLDLLFHQKLSAHLTPPSREIWERLEDEHLRPTKRRAAAWWPMAMAAAVALLLVAGGAGLWLGFPFRNTQVATRTSNQPKQSTRGALTRSNTATGAQSSGAIKAERNHVSEQPAVAANTTPQPSKSTPLTSSQKKTITEATRTPLVASTASKARTSTLGKSNRQQMGTSRQPDADANRSSLVAHTTPKTTQPTAADEPRKPADIAPVVAATATHTPAPEIVPAGTIPASGLTGDLITVDVRTGSAPAARPAKMVTTALAELAEPAERRRLGGRLLHQAGNLVRGERVSLAEVTGLPENVTLRATVAGRSITKSIQL